jgi:hypothetical protein
MQAWTLARGVALAVGVASAALLGCGPNDNGGYGGYSYSGGGSSGRSSTATDDGGTSTQPMIVVVDPNRTMNASPGQGVGVFTQYQTGGHWNIWWTCDTTKTGLSCPFDVTVSANSGTIANAAGQSLQRTDSLDQASADQIEVTTTTTTAVQGVTFDTVLADSTATPIITVTAELNGVADPSYFFFVQDGEINGGFQGNLTDPLMFEPSSP